jgi:hypothetical protein
MSFNEDSGNRAVPWIWSVLEHRIPPENNTADHGIISESEIDAFFSLLQCLPPQLVLTKYQGEPAVLGLDELARAVNDKARNHVVRGIALPIGILCHILLMLASLQGHGADIVSSFLRDCPLVLTSVLVHWTAIGCTVASSFRCLDVVLGVSFAR